MSNQLKYLKALRPIAELLLYTFLLNQTNEKTGIKKINNSILLDVNYIRLIKRVISDFIEFNAQEDASPHTLWETPKCVVRGVTIKFCTLQKKIIISITIST